MKACPRNGHILHESLPKMVISSMEVYPNNDHILNESLPNSGHILHESLSQ